MVSLAYPLPIFPFSLPPAIPKSANCEPSPPGRRRSRSENESRRETKRNQRTARAQLGTVKSSSPKPCLLGPKFESSGKCGAGHVGGYVTKAVCVCPLYKALGLPSKARARLKKQECHFSSSLALFGPHLVACRRLSRSSNPRCKCGVLRKRRSRVSQTPEFGKSLSPALGTLMLRLTYIVKTK